MGKVLILYVTGSNLWLIVVRVLGSCGFYSLRKNNGSGIYNR